MIGIVVYYVITERLTEQAGTQLLILGAAAVVLMVAMPDGLWRPLSMRGRLAPFPVHNRLDHRHRPRPASRLTPTSGRPDHQADH